MSFTLADALEMYFGLPVELGIVDPDIVLRSDHDRVVRALFDVNGVDFGYRHGDGDARPTVTLQSVAYDNEIRTAHFPPMPVNSALDLLTFAANYGSPRARKTIEYRRDRIMLRHAGPLLDTLSIIDSAFTGWATGDKTAVARIRHRLLGHSPSEAAERLLQALAGHGVDLVVHAQRILTETDF